jgi:hypothetical protein
MGVSTQQKLNAANIADAVFSSMVSHRAMDTSSDSTHDPETVQILLTSIDDGLKAAGLSFAEYLERIRHAHTINISQDDRRWRFSARERAVQRVDSAVAHLCALMQSEQV